jgi:small subunit ribosomal protein S17
MKRGKVLEGVVVSDKNDKTITVLVKKKFSHNLYNKPTMSKKKYKVHDKNNEAKSGDRVKIRESRPFSKEKYFKLIEVVK